MVNQNRDSVTPEVRIRGHGRPLPAKGVGVGSPSDKVRKGEDKSLCGDAFDHQTKAASIITWYLLLKDSLVERRH